MPSPSSWSQRLRAKAIRDSLSHADPSCWWLDDVDAPEQREVLTGSQRTDLAVVGGGYSGLWTALLAKQEDPARDVVLLEGARLGWAASGRNGGFCSASLTHGQANGLDWYPADMPRLERLGRANLAGIIQTIEDFGIDCKLERTGEMTVATENYQIGDLTAGYERMLDFGDDALLLDETEVRSQVYSPTYRAGLWGKNKTVLVDPARLVWGLADACERLGVRICEASRVRSLSRVGRQIQLDTEYGRVLADRVALGTNAFPSLLKRIRPYVVPVYDYAMATEPLSEGQLAELGWRNRQGVADSGHRFHYYRLTDDNSIIWGGYDAVYHYGSRIDTSFEQRAETFTRLAEHSFTTFPQLEGLQFANTWGRVIDTCSRFFPFFGTGYQGQVAYAIGYTGLGVGATRFGAQVMLDLLNGHRADLTLLETIRAKPLPFPPEPLRKAVIAATVWSLAKADARGGHRNLWLRTMDRFGLGFDT